MTHGLPFIDWRDLDTVPGWSSEFDLWAADALARGDVEELARFRSSAPGHALRAPDGRALHAAVRHPRRRHRPGRPVTTTIDGYAIGLAKRSFQAA